MSQVRFANSQGSLNKNTKKTSDKAPDYNGKLELDAECIRYLVEGIKKGDAQVKISISGWLKDGDWGKWISLSLSTPYEKSAAPRPGGSPPGRGTQSFDPEDNIPF